MRLVAGVLLMALMFGLGPAHGEDAIGKIVSREIRDILPRDNAGGAAVAVRLRGRTHFYNYGFADRSGARPITSDSLFNLASLGKVFDAVLLALAIERRELSLDDPVARYVPELNAGGNIKRVTIGELATHTSGLLLPQDHPPWPTDSYTLSEFLRTLATWEADDRHTPVGAHMYSHAGYVLLHLALERRYGVPLAELIRERITAPLGLASTLLPFTPRSNPRGDLEDALKSRAVQGYEDSGRPIGEPGDIQGYYHWAGAGQMFSSARDMASFLAANMGEVPQHPELSHAMILAQRGLVAISPNNDQALAWEVNKNDIPIVEKNGGLDNTSSYIALIPSHKIGVVILSNRGNQACNEVGRRILLELAARWRISAQH